MKADEAQKCYIDFQSTPGDKSSSQRIEIEDSNQSGESAATVKVDSKHCSHKDIICKAL